MAVSTNVGGTWQTMSALYVNISGTWQACSGVWVNVSGTWQRVYTAPRGMYKRSMEGNSSTTNIDYIAMTSAGNTSYFGQLSFFNYGYSGLSSSTRAVFSGGRWYDSSMQSQGSILIQYMTIATTGNASYFGSLSNALVSTAGLANATRGVIIGGQEFDWYYYNLMNINYMKYITIASTGNSNYYGSLTTAQQVMLACASPTRGLDVGGYYQVTDMRYTTIASGGDAGSFGTLYRGRHGAGAMASSTRAVFAGGVYRNTSIEYVTIATLGNGASFGSLTVDRGDVAASSSSIKGLLYGGRAYSTGNQWYSEYITIATTGNGAIWGVLIEAGASEAGVSNAHGGL